ncbi:CARDB domain-containing protein [Aquifex sp.]
MRKGSVKYLFASSLILANLMLISCGGGGGGNTGSTSDQTTPPPKPDVALQSINPNVVTVSPGQQIQIDIQLTNKGNADANNITIEIYLSRDNTIDSNDAKIGELQGINLPSGDSVNTSLSVTIPSNVTAGTYYLIANATVTDDANTVDNVNTAQIDVIIINTTSAGIAVVSTGNQDIALIPSGQSLAPVPLNPAASNIQPTALKPQQSNCRQIGNQGWVCSIGNPPQTTFTIDSCAADPVALKVVCIGYDSQNVAIFDISTYVNTLNPQDITVEECNLDPNKTIPRAGFSGGSCINCGVATDPGDNRFIVASGDGFRVVGYTIQSGACDVQKTYLLSDYNIASINENFAYDPQRDWILNPEYYVPFGGSAKFWIIDVTNDKVYSWDKEISCANLDPNNLQCRFSELDSISIDISTGISIIADESFLTYLLVDLGQANFNTSNNTFSAPYTIAYLENTSALRYTGTAIEPTTHIAFMEEEFGNGIAVLQLPSASGSNGTFPVPTNWEYNSLNLTTNDVCDSNPGDGNGIYGWSNPGDPHGLSVFTASNNGVAYGIAISDTKDCIAVVDLQKFLNAPKAPNTDYVDPNYDLFSNGVLYYIKIQ